MICFRSLNLWYLPQLHVLNSLRHQGCDLLSFFEFMIFATTVFSYTAGAPGCDLLSFFEFMIFATTIALYTNFNAPLWFAFVLWIYDICHNWDRHHPGHSTVVICFRSLNLWYLPQPPLWPWLVSVSCDLLSFFEFMIFATTIALYTNFNAPLWFAFVLWIYDICHNGWNII